MKKNVFTIILILNITLNSFAQDCSSLRKANETYGDGDTFVSWCDMKSKTPYTQCMCEQQKSKKASAIEQQNLHQQALAKGTEASALYQQASNLAIQANLDKDPTKLDEAKALYQQAIALSNQAKGFIKQAYAGSDDSYNRLKNLYLEQHNKQIAWATTGIEGISNQKERIKAETNQKQIKLTPKKPSASNNWNLSIETEAENSWGQNTSNSDNGWGSQTLEGMEKVVKIVNRNIVENGDCDNSISLTYSEEGYIDSFGQWVVDPIKTVSINEIKAPPRLLLARSDCDYDCKKRMEKERNERYRRCHQLLEDKIVSIKENLKSQGYIIK